ASELLGKLLQHALRGFGVELHAAAIEVIRVEPAEHDARIRYGRLIAAGPVASWARHGAGALRANPQQAAGIDPGDRTATGADAAHVDRRHRHHVAQPAPAEPAIARVNKLAVAHQADVEGRAAGVTDDGVAA